MTKRVEYFGGKTHGHIVLENGHSENIPFDRELWFDCDLDGRWLVGVTNCQHPDADVTGAIVVKNPTIGAFIQLLGRLVIEPARFTAEQVVIGPTWDGRLSDD